MNGLSYDDRLAGAGSKEAIRAGEFDADTLKENTEVTLFAVKVADDQVLFHGYGASKRARAEAFTNLDLRASGNGAGSSGDPIGGDVVLAITDSQQKRVLASETFDDLAELRDSANETRSDRIIEEARAPYANPGRFLEVRIEADADSDGLEVDPTASTGKLYYGEIQG